VGERDQPKPIGQTRLRGSQINSASLKPAGCSLDEWLVARAGRAVNTLNEVGARRAFGLGLGPGSVIECGAGRGRGGGIRSV